MHLCPTPFRQLELAIFNDLVRMLERAIVIATEAHAGVRDKGGAPYIFHPLRLMLGMTTEAEQIAAVLHDVVEGLRLDPRRPP